jgi:hypothetical protein
MKTTPKTEPQSQPMQPATTPPPPDLAADVAAQLSLSRQIVKLLLAHNDCISQDAASRGDHERRLRKLEGEQKEAGSTAPGDAAAAAIERLGDQLAKDFDYHFNRVTARLDHL